MKIKPLHISIILLFLTGFCIPLFALQDPQYTKRFDPDFKERYSGNTYNYEGKKIVGQTLNGSGNYEAYKKKKDDIEIKEDNNAYYVPPLISNGITWLFYVILAIAVIFLVYFLLKDGGTGFFTSKRNRKINRTEDITAENIEHTDITTLIQNAENNADYRLAIRYYYLLTLKNLSLKNYIKFEDDKTNSEYLNELSDKPFYGKFDFNSYLYNYIWYGEFPLNNVQYQKAKGHFSTLLNLIK
ncbi:MAG: hypothetical protein ACK5MZ_10085 [Aestuariibaculum sp.]